MSAAGDSLSTSGGETQRLLLPQDIAEQVREIAAMGQGDPEAAHGFEDSLVRRVLEAIANGNPYPRSLAMTVVQTYKSDFPRWTA